MNENYINPRIEYCCINGEHLIHLSENEYYEMLFHFDEINDQLFAEWMGWTE